MGLDESGWGRVVARIPGVWELPFLFFGGVPVGDSRRLNLVDPILTHICVEWGQLGKSTHFCVVSVLFEKVKRKK